MATKTVINWDRRIEFGSGWNCCIGNEKFVIVFDNGVRWAVCSACSNSYGGSVHSLAVFAPESFTFSWRYIKTMGWDK